MELPASIHSFFQSPSVKIDLVSVKKKPKMNRRVRTKKEKIETKKRERERGTRRFILLLLKPFANSNTHSKMMTGFQNQNIFGLATVYLCVCVCMWNFRVFVYAALSFLYSALNLYERMLSARSWPMSFGWDFINCCRATSRDDWSEDRIKSAQQIATFWGYIPTLIRPHNISFFLFFSSFQLYENSIRSETFQVATLLLSFSVWYSWTVPIEYTNNVFFHSI